MSTTAPSSAQPQNQSVELLRSRYREIQQRRDEAAARAGRNPSDITIIAVSKTKPTSMLNAAMQAGIDTFGENYAQELYYKAESLGKAENLGDSFRVPPQPAWHFIGRLQRNKVKLIAPIVSCIHSLDSIKLAMEVSRQAEKHGRVIEALIQVNITDEATKAGCSVDDTFALAESSKALPGLKLRGLMTIGALAAEAAQVRTTFRRLRDLLCEVRQTLDMPSDFRELSMGMTGDFETAIEEGATMVRIGTAIFGPRI